MISLNVQEHNDFFNEMLLMLDKEEEEEENICLIDGEQLSEGFIELKCSHKFNYLSLLNEVKSQKKYNHLEVQKLKSFQIKCPYCRNIHDGVLPYNKNLCIKKMKGVNWPPSKVLKFKSCTALIKSGKRKGEMCGKACFFDFCNIHNKSTTTNKKINKKTNKKQNIAISVCNAIVKSGKRKGEKCGCKCKTNEQFCGRHINKKKYLIEKC